MKISAAFAILQDLRFAAQAAFLPTVLAILKSPLLIVRPREVSRIFMSHVWKLFGNGVDEGGRPVKEELIRANASGVVLDLGAGKWLLTILKIRSALFADILSHIVSV